MGGLRPDGSCQESDTGHPHDPLGDRAGRQVAGDHGEPPDAGEMRHPAPGVPGRHRGAAGRRRKGAVPDAAGFGKDSHGAGGGEPAERLPGEREIP